MRFLKNKISRSAQAKIEKDKLLTEREFVKQEFVCFENSDLFVKEESLSNEDQSIILKEEPTYKEFFKEDCIQPKRKTGITISSKPPRSGKQDCTSAKTVVKNYGKAIASFAVSSLAIPYLVPIVEQEKLQLTEFTEYVLAARDTIEGIDGFRAMLLPKTGDGITLAAYKRAFGKIAEVFINYFSVNWIYSGRMSNKKVHVMMRFKMLRRIQNPELFTYLK